MVDDFHSTGFMGTRAGTAGALAYFGQIDIITGTFGKKLGERIRRLLQQPKEVIEMLRQGQDLICF